MMKALPLIVLVLSAALLISVREYGELHEVLIITGGKAVDQAHFFTVFDAIEGIKYSVLSQPEANDIYSSPDIDRYRVLVFYDMVQEITDAQKQAFLDLLQRGKSILFLHHSLVSYQDWAEYEQIVGGRYYESTNEEDRRRYTQSAYRHDVTIPVAIVDTTHPVTKGLSDFDIFDEVYNHYNVLPGVTPLLKTTHPESEEVIGWTHTYGNSQIVYIQLGHGYQAFKDPNFRQLVRQSVDWLIERDRVVLR